LKVDTRYLNVLTWEEKAVEVRAHSSARRNNCYTHLARTPCSRKIVIALADTAFSARVLFWLAVLYSVVRLTLADSKAVLLAYYASLRLFSCSYFTYITVGSRAAKFARAQESPAHEWVT
jgi:hypothetical protein